MLKCVLCLEEFDKPPIVPNHALNDYIKGTRHIGCCKRINGRPYPLVVDSMVDNFYDLHLKAVVINEPIDWSSFSL